MTTMGFVGKLVLATVTFAAGFGSAWFISTKRYNQYIKDEHEQVRSTYSKKIREMREENDQLRALCNSLGGNPDVAKNIPVTDPEVQDVLPPQMPMIPDRLNGPVLTDGRDGNINMFDIASNAGYTPQSNFKRSTPSAYVIDPTEANEYISDSEVDEYTALITVDDDRQGMNVYDFEDNQVNPVSLFTAPGANALFKQLLVASDYDYIKLAIPKNGVVRVSLVQKIPG